jgi:serine protease Do
VQYAHPAPAPKQQQPQPPPQPPDPWANTRPEWSQGRAHLGVVIQPMTGNLRMYFGTPPDRGVLVAHVATESPAAQAGLQVGDVLVFADGHLVRTNEDLRTAIDQHGPGTMRLDVIRRGAPMQTQVTIPEPPPSSPMM